jgi:hypothetical protein
MTVEGFNSLYRGANSHAIQADHVAVCLAAHWMGCASQESQQQEGNKG